MVASELCIHEGEIIVSHIVGNYKLNMIFSNLVLYVLFGVISVGPLLVETLIKTTKNITCHKGATNPILGQINHKSLYFSCPI